MKSQPKWLRALGRARDPVYVVNGAQQIVCWNAGVQKLLGYSQAEVLNQLCYQIIGGKVCGKSWCRAGCLVQRSARRGVPLQTFDLRVSARDGHEVSLNVSVFFFERKDRPFAIHLLRDMTREEHTKEALERVLDTLRAYGVTNGQPKGDGSAVPEVFPLRSEASSVAQLTRREIEVLELMAEGFSTRDVAQRLGISPFTVRSHIERILFKTGLHTQAQAVAYAYRAGLL